jgi:hypothetical protein
MNASPRINADGTVDLIDFSFSPDEATEAFYEYVDKRMQAEDDWDNGRHDHFDRWTAPARDKAGEDLAMVVGIRFADLDDFEAFLIRCFNEVRKARRAS